MQTLNQRLWIDYANKSFIKQSLTRRLRFWWHYWRQGYSVKTSWLLAGGR